MLNLSIYFIIKLTIENFTMVNLFIFLFYFQTNLLTNLMIKIEEENLTEIKNIVS